MNFIMDFSQTIFLSGYKCNTYSLQQTWKTYKGKKKNKSLTILLSGRTTLNNPMP